MGLLRLVLDLLHLSKPIERTQAYDPHPVNAKDLRGAFPYKTRLIRPDPEYQIIPYVQVFQDRYGFIPNMSILDLLFCAGPETVSILRRSIVQSKTNPT